MLTHSASAITAQPTPTPSPTPAAPGTDTVGPSPLDQMLHVAQNTEAWQAMAVLLVLLAGAAVATNALWPAFSAPRGFATGAQLRRELSARSARKLAAVTRPSLKAHLRSVPVREYTVPVGRSSSPWRRVYGTPEDTYLVVGPPRSYKSVWLNNVIADAPGAVIHTSSKLEDHEATADLRAQIGPVLLFNPERLDGVPSTLRWSPISGCENPKVAISRAGNLLYGARSGGDTPYEDYFRSTACNVLRAYLHAAALGGCGMAEVMRWVADPDDTTALDLLKTHRAEESWSAYLRQQHDLTEKTRDGVWGSLSTALAWMADPAVAETVTPGPGEQFDAEAFIRAKGTLYLIGDDKEDASTIAPLFTALTAHLVDVAKQVAAATPGRRLDPPLTLALDEVANICPIPLHKWIADCSGRGITVIACIQSRSQLESRWGRYNASTIWNSAAFTLVTRGIKDDHDLESLSKICGERDQTQTSTSHGPNGATRTRSTQRVRVIPPEGIRMLHKRRLLVIHRGTPPTIVTVTPIYKRRDIRKQRKALRAAADADLARPGATPAEPERAEQSA